MTGTPFSHCFTTSGGVFASWCSARRTEFFMPDGEERSFMHLLVRTENDPTGLVAALRTEIGAVDTMLPVDRVDMIEGLISNTLGEERYRALLIGIFAFAAGIGWSLRCRLAVRRPTDARNGNPHRSRSTPRPHCRDGSRSGDRHDRRLHRYGSGWRDAGDAAPRHGLVGRRTTGCADLRRCGRLRYARRSACQLHPRAPGDTRRSDDRAAARIAPRNWTIEIRGRRFETLVACNSAIGTSVRPNGGGF